MDYAQEKVYIRSRAKSTRESTIDQDADNIVRLFTEIGAVLTDEQAGPPQSQVAYRAQKYLEAKRILSSELKAQQTSQQERLVSSVSEWVREGPAAKLPVLLPTTVLVGASRQFINDLAAVDQAWLCVSIHSKEATSFKQSVKLIVKRMVEDNKINHLLKDLEETYNLDKRLIYDFEFLENLLELKPLSQLVVFLEDADELETEIIQGLITYMHAYCPRLPLHLVMNLVGSIDVFEQQLTQTAMSKLRSRAFAGVSAEGFVANCVGNLRAASVPVTDKAAAAVTSQSLQRCFYDLLYACLSFYAGNPYSFIDAGNHTNFLAIISQLNSIAKFQSEGKQPSEALVRTLAAETYGRLDGSLPPNNDFLGVMSECLIEHVETIRNSMYPDTRASLETVLSEPTIYLTPARRHSIGLSILYQLCRQASVYVNIYDLYCAYESSIGDSVFASGHDRARTTLAWFLQLVAELKLIGIVRDSKRKFECLEKVAWKDV